MLDPHPAGIETREVEQVGGELRQPIDLLPHRLEELLPRRLVELLVRHQLQEAGEREERRAQLVGGVGDELAPRPVEHLEPDAHPLEGCRELTQLVVARVHHRLVESAAGDPLGCALEPPDPACVHRRQGVAGHDREQKPDHARDQQPPFDQMQTRERIRERVAEQDHGARVPRGARPRQTTARRARPSPVAASRVRGSRSAIGSRSTSSDESVVLESP